MRSLEEYFDSYEHISNAWEDNVRRARQVTGDPSFTPDYGYPEELLATTFKRADGTPKYTPVTEEPHPDLYQAIQDEVAFRGLEKAPPFYIDHSGETRLGRALSKYHCIHIEDGVTDVFKPRELRALVAHEIKHLYQKREIGAAESWRNELDADRAAVTSTDYATVRSYAEKAARMQIEQQIPTSLLRKAALAVFNIAPGFTCEKAYVRLDKWHPSPATRLREMHREALTHSTPEVL